MDHRVGKASPKGRFRRRSLGLGLALVLTATPAAVAGSERLEHVLKDTQARGSMDADTWGGVADTRKELRRLWREFDQEGPLPTIRFKRNIAILAGMGGSSSCPPEIKDLRLKRELKRVVVRIHSSSGDKGEACTDDLAPRTFTVTVSRSQLAPLEGHELHVRTRPVP